MRITALIFVFILTACSSSASVQTSQNSAQNSSEPQLEPARFVPYQLQVGDVLAIKFLLNPELNEQVMVTPDGMISTTIVQNVRAAGRDVVELRKELEEYYAEYLIEPKISVIVQSFAPTRVYVMGEVEEPGEYVAVGTNMTLLQAIAQAGDVLPSARTDEIILLRREGNGKPKAYVANYQAAASGADPYSDIILSSSDVIYVPRTDVANLYQTYDQYIRQFLPPSFSLGYQLNPDD